MKLKVSEWGNSHGLRLSSAILAHLRVKAGEEVDIALTDKGIEIIKNHRTLDYFNAVQADVTDAILMQTNPVNKVDDPYQESDVAYIVVAINPCSPLIREVPKDTANAHLTLADAKEAARQIIQSTLAGAQKSLSELRQLGIDDISYIAL